ncbi:Type I restriction enzyme R protein N terminus (HSDR_N) [Micromonospora chersina]|uniref:Type I restriction enzyme R protein N terminus (HSDR_N) n=1 Tax=Micromonospora chersina TaxID=47854 RepID=A0A1C6URK7_9ACTN|nr:Type I restriction enzyme R protein N terminus (HSDR_N) [Micromonospora chersina]
MRLFVSASTREVTTLPEVHLTVGESKIKQFLNKKPLETIEELIWNGLDADARTINIELERNPAGALAGIVITDDGHGFSFDEANEYFPEYGDTWKKKIRASRTRNRILHGRNGEGRLFALSLGPDPTWESVAAAGDGRVRTRVRGNSLRPLVWNIDLMDPAGGSPGTQFRVRIPDERRLRSLEPESAVPRLTARLSFYLLAYPEVTITYDGFTLDPRDVIEQEVDLALELPPEYTNDPNPPKVRFVEWKERVADQKLLICNGRGEGLLDYGSPYSYSILSFTPYLIAERFNDLSQREVHMIPMVDASLLHSAILAVRRHVTQRQREISSNVVSQLQDEGIYPYDGKDLSETEEAERQTFDLVVTVARSALANKLVPRKFQVELLRAALENDPSDLHEILDNVLALSDEERADLTQLIKDTHLAHVISSAKTVVDRLNFISALRNVFADTDKRNALREIDQLHPMIASNLWLFGEEWNFSQTEQGLTSVLAQHLSRLGQEVTLENRLQSVKRDDGRSGRVDIVMFRGIGDEHHTQRLVIELKRPSLRVGSEELEQVKSYARAIVRDPQYKHGAGKWKFILVTYDIAPEIEYDIKQEDREPGHADKQRDYDLWVLTWGQIFDDAERKLRFFQRRLNYEATEERAHGSLAKLTEEYGIGLTRTRSRQAASGNTNGVVPGQARRVDTAID